jgi:hypothetical protein
MSYKHKYYKGQAVGPTSGIFNPGNVDLDYNCDIYTTSRMVTIHAMISRYCKFTMIYEKFQANYERDMILAFGWKYKVMKLLHII